MAFRPRRKQYHKTKHTTCKKCGARLRRRTFRCKRCHVAAR